MTIAKPASEGVRQTALSRTLPFIVIASLIAGLAIGTWLRLVPDGGWTAALVKGVDVVGVMWVNAIRMTVIPLIVPLLIGSIAGSKNSRAAGRLSVTTTLTFVGLLAVVSAATTLVAPFLFAGLRIDPVAVEGLRASVSTVLLPSGDASLSGWFKSLVPTNPVKAAADGSMLSIVVFSLAFGFAALAAPPVLRARVIAFAETLSGIMLVMVQAVLLLAPVGVFALAFGVGVHMGSTAFGIMGYFIGAELVCTAAIGVALFALIVVRGRMAPSRAIRGMAPALLVAAGTSSSLSALPAMIEGTRDHWGQREEIYGFVLPLAVSAFKLASASSWILDAVFVAVLYDIPLGPAQYVLLAGYAVLFNATVPGIPGGGIIVVSPLFLALDLPLEGLAILFAVNPIVDRIVTLGNVAANMAATTIVGARR